MAKHLPALHPELADGACGRRAPINEQQPIVTAVGMELRGQDALLAILGLEDDGAGPVAEQDAGGAVFPIEDPAERFRADDQRPLGVAAAEHRIGDAQRVEKSGANGVNIESDAIVDPEQRLHLGCG